MKKSILAIVLSGLTMSAAAYLFITNPILDLSFSVMSQVWDL